MAQLIDRPICGEPMCSPIVNFKSEGKDICFGIQTEDYSQPIRKCTWCDGKLEDRTDISKLTALIIIQALTQMLVELEKGEEEYSEEAN